jgi:hypothetical protein
LAPPGNNLAEVSAPLSASSTVGQRATMRFYPASKILDKPGQTQYIHPILKPIVGYSRKIEADKKPWAHPAPTDREWQGFRGEIPCPDQEI